MTAREAGLTVHEQQTYQAALRRLIAPMAFQDVKFLNRKSSVDLTKIDPDLLRWVRAMARECEAMAIPLFVIEGYRSPERQAELKAKGNSKADPGLSPHQYGCAVDLVHYGLFWNLTEKEWAVVGQLGKEVARKQNLDLTWGGDFKSLWDPAHWELTNWLSDWRKRR